MRLIRTAAAPPRRAVAAGSAAALAAALAAGCSTDASLADDVVGVGVIQEATGTYANYAKQFNGGFKAGLDLAGGGTGVIAGRKVKVTYLDSGGNAAKAISQAKDLIGKGYKFIVGPVDSGVAQQLAPLAWQNKVVFIPDGSTDESTGANRYTFRASMQTWQQIATTAEYLGLAGKRVVLLGQDSAFGQTYGASLKTYLAKKGLPPAAAEVAVPMGAQDFTPFAVKVKNARPDVLFVAFAGTAKARMFRALDEQGVLDKAAATAELPLAAEYTAFGDSAGKILYYARHFAGAVDTPEDRALSAGARKHGAPNEQISSNGFTTAQMIQRAVTEGGGRDADKMVKALEGWRFQGPKGPFEIRSADHAMLQPMLVARLVKDGASWKPKLVKALDPADTAPPPAPMAVK
ncbi:MULTISPECIES: ABC transporter substrate-binding protein [Thermomonosporaceae]|uniref:ABC transporter substrate-binding protein n=1 Tax=Thermomonosporaceae TaxID=2012 RepID=UPI00255A79C8|nr:MULTISPECIES: ABC transporter substrate-binding protein [Thermomonosporaceae]MDL4777411.1 ABC transporter substrate-binding protein [Actinomadura xylanilytica]